MGTSSIELEFVGPFKFSGEGESVFRTSLSNSSGIYIWTIKQQKDNTHLIHYIGETTSFGTRHKEHLVSNLGLDYAILDAEKAERGICKFIWKGLRREKSSKARSKIIDTYIKIHKDVTRYLSVLNIFFAETKIDDHMRIHIKECIGSNLRDNHPECSVLYQDNHRLGVMSKDHGELIITLKEPIRGLDPRIPY